MAEGCAEAFSAGDAGCQPLSQALARPRTSLGGTVLKVGDHDPARLSSSFKENERRLLSCRFPTRPVSAGLQDFVILFIPRNDNGQEKRSVLIVSVLLPIIIDLVSYGTLVAVSAPRVMLLHDSDIPIGMFHLRLVIVTVINNQLPTIDLALRSKKQRRI